MESEAGEYINRFFGGKIFLGFVICEAPGVVEGFYFNGKEKIMIEKFQGLSRQVERLLIMRCAVW